jgi:hypothetical protein
MTTTAPLGIPSGAFFSPQTVINDSDTAIIKSRLRKHSLDEGVIRVKDSGQSLD